jgi:hypothetical protein
MLFASLFNMSISITNYHGLLGVNCMVLCRYPIHNKTKNKEKYIEKLIEKVTPITFTLN